MHVDGEVAMDAAILAIDFSEAKSHLSEVMSLVVRDHQPRLVRRHHGKETMLLLNLEDAEGWLHAFHFEPEVVIADGEVTAQLSRFGLLGFGTTVDEALGDLLSELRAYTQRFFERAN